MCVLALGWRAHPRWQLVLAGNRDERHDRPTADLAAWPDPSGLIAGKDLKSGGTWLGLCEGRVGVVTNLRGFGAAADAPSRGLLLADMLTQKGAYARPSADALARFNAFNLILAAPDSAILLSNRPIVTRQKLAPGIHGLANGPVDPPWAKTVRLQTFLRDWLTDERDDPALLLDRLADETVPVAQNPVPGDPLSPIFLRNPLYGTRSSTVIAIDAEGQTTIIERRFDRAGEAEGETALTLVQPQWAQA